MRDEDLYAMVFEAATYTAPPMYVAISAPRRHLACNALDATWTAVMTPTTKSAALCGVLTGVGTLVADLVNGPIQRAVPALGQGGTFVLLMIVFFVAPVMAFVFGVSSGSTDVYPRSGESMAARGAGMKRGLVWFAVHVVVWLCVSELYGVLR